MHVFEFVIEGKAHGQKCVDRGYRLLSPKGATQPGSFAATANETLLTAVSSPMTCHKLEAQRGDPTWLAIGLGDGCKAAAHHPEEPDRSFLAKRSVEADADC